MLMGECLIDMKKGGGTVAEKGEQQYNLERRSRLGKGQVSQLLLWREKDTPNKNPWGKRGRTS